MKGEKPEGDEYIVSPCLRQKVENLLVHSNESPWEWDKSIIVKWIKAQMKQGGKVHERKESDFVIGPSLKWI